MNARTLMGAAALASLCLAGCSLNVGGKAPPFLLTLTPNATLPANGGQSTTSAQLVTIAVPIVPQAIATNRIPVADGQTAIAYVKNASWVEPPARLFQRLLAETVRVKTGRVVLEPRQMQGDAAAQLTGQLLHFGIDANRSEAIVIYDAALTRDKGKTIETRRFVARAPVGVINAASSGAALNRAANDVANDVAVWIG